ncbi:hypothetical protein GGD92_00475 [Pseudomonas protegens]|uniref:Uncharacterized protein n=1 Tax=Pseudomonas protegens TaxID=380021 RepID=A0A7G7XA16_9PSED|nr:hypothetical protein [Pseudomonas protegens]QNH76811.1 hypothetical protein GGI48_26610 [Pseudomonas protegens]QNL06007.1 hypothetical protein GGD92_00475 [Pseudomonas protegens]RBJ82495.1 hypothetical protein C3L29_014660 [Pseudomonas sp. MWU12-2534b]
MQTAGSKSTSTATATAKFIGSPAFQCEQPHQPPQAIDVRYPEDLAVVVDQTIRAMCELSKRKRCGTALPQAVSKEEWNNALLDEIDERWLRAEDKTLPKH